MIVMLDTGPAQWDLAASELAPYPVEQLLTPLTRYARRDGRFAIDNGAFSRFNPQRFRDLLERHRDARDQCRFVALPDVVGNARRTLECFEYWWPRTRPWPAALVVQDGQQDLGIPWDCIDAVFVGGTTEFKLGEHATAIVRAAKAMEKWVHVGRVNTRRRFDWARGVGADSVDGTGLSRYSGMRLKMVLPHAPRLALEEP